MVDSFQDLLSVQHNKNESCKSNFQPHIKRGIIIIGNDLHQGKLPETLTGMPNINLLGYYQVNLGITACLKSPLIRPFKMI